MGKRKKGNQLEKLKRAKRTKTRSKKHAKRLTKGKSAGTKLHEMMHRHEE